MSFGFMSLILPAGTPSTITMGSLAPSLVLIELFPLIKIFEDPPGPALPVVTKTPGALPLNISPISVDGTFNMSSA